MRIGIISDTHDQSIRTGFAIQQLKSEGAEVLFHCGDLTEPDMVATCAVMPCYFVFGNNDLDAAREIQKAIDSIEDCVCLGWSGAVHLAGKRIAMAHGHLTADVRRMLDAQPDYLFSGHSHIAADSQAGTTRRINPGALHRASKFSVALLDLATDVLKFLTVPR